jgi:hypothetical protein
MKPKTEKALKAKIKRFENRIEKMTRDAVTLEELAKPLEMLLDSPYEVGEDGHLYMPEPK